MFFATMSKKTSAIYPINLIGLDKVKTIVVGGGIVGQRKITKLITAGANVQLISPMITDQLQEWAATGQIEWLCRDYQPGDLSVAKLVFATTNQRETNAQIAQEARDLGILCNVADNPSEGNFHVPAVYWGEQITVAVSTAGNNPTIARQIRDKIAVWLDEQK
jgi:cobalt-precorrin 5A hydrolase/precorrin-3B C17-methyltransferase